MGRVAVSARGGAVQVGFRGRRRGVRWWSVPTVFVLLATGLPAPTAAQTAELASGTYAAVLTGSGTLTGAAEGGDFLVQFAQTAHATFLVEDGTVTGTWEGSGSKTLHVATPEGDVFQATDETSQGTVAGDPSTLVLDGVFEPDVKVFTFAGRPLPVSPSGTHRLEPPGTVEIVRASCGQADGDWVERRTAEAAEAGFELVAVGAMTAVRTDGSVRTEALRAALSALATDAQAQLWQIADEGVDAFDAWALVALLEQAEALLASISPADLECELLVPVHLLRAHLRQLLSLVLDDPGGLSVPQLVMLLSGGVRTGAIGAGGDDGPREAIRDELERRVREGDGREACQAAVALAQFGMIGNVLEGSEVPLC